MKNLIYFIYLFIFISFSCGKKECNSFSGAYEFEIKATLSPALDTFNIGDTIHIKSEFSNMIYERKTDQTYLLENFNFYPWTIIRKIDTIPIDDGALNYFDILIKGKYDYEQIQLSSGTSALLGNYNYDNNKYSLSFELIPLKKGLYFFSQFSGIVGSGNEEQDFPGKCNLKGNDAALLLNGGIDNNVDFLKDSPDEGYNTTFWNKQNEKFHDAGGYCFYVKE